MNQHMIKLKAKPSILALILLCLAFNSAGTAHAVIPQLLGPLSALLSIVPQIPRGCRYRLFNCIRVRSRLAKGIVLPYP